MTTTLLDLKPAQILPHGKNPRTSIGDVADLADSIRSMGILEPLVVAPIDGKPDKYRLIAGHRRHAAAKVAKTGTVPCLVRDDLDTEPKQLEAMLVENLHRTDLTPIEEGDAYVDLLALAGYTQAKLAKALGRTPATIRERVKVAKLPDAARAKVNAGQLSIGDAIELAKYEDDHQAFDRLLNAVGTSNWRYYLEQARADQLAKAQAAALAKKLRRDGITVYEDDEPDGSKPLSEITGIHEYSKKEYDQTIAEHQTCPGHAVVITPSRYGRSDTAICTRPDLHPAEQVEDDRERRRREAVAERNKVDADLATAAVARRQWLWEQLDNATAVRPVEDLAVDLARAALADRLGDAADLFGRAMGIADNARVEGARQLRSQLQSMSLPQLVILDNLAASAMSEKGLANDFAWPHGESRYYSGKAWIQVLTDVYAYPWSDFEQTMLQTADDGEDDETRDVEDVTGPDDISDRVNAGFSAASALDDQDDDFSPDD